MASPWARKKSGLTKRSYGWPEDEKFLVPPRRVRVISPAGIGARGASLRREWAELFESYRSQYPELANEIELMQRRELQCGMGS